MSEKGPAMELLDAIRSVADVEFFRAPYATSTSELPLLVWRYANKGVPERLIAAIHEIIESAIKGRRVEWLLRYVGRNWVLAPKRFVELEDSNAFRLYPEILRHLERTDPNFTQLSNVDLQEISRQVGDSLQELSRNLPSLH